MKKYDKKETIIYTLLGTLLILMLMACAFKIYFMENEREDIARIFEYICYFTETPFVIGGFIYLRKYTKIRKQDIKDGK